MSVMRAAVVTGGASGFGAAICGAFINSGINVLIADVDGQRAEEFASKISSERGKATALQCDVTIPDDVAKIVNRSLEAFGRLDVLVNNAGTLGPAGAFEQTTLADFEDIFAVNCRGVFLGCQAVVPHFRKQHSGVIINIASGSALRPRAGATVYAASKGAVITLTRALASEMAPHGVRVNVICPAISRTELAERFVNDSSDVLWDQLAKEIPLGRLVQPSDVANAAAFLASDSASMITGTCLAVDGGRCI